jgi:hypothetical protein
VVPAPFHQRTPDLHDAVAVDLHAVTDHVTGTLFKWKRITVKTTRTKLRGSIAERNKKRQFDGQMVYAKTERQIE